MGYIHILDTHTLEDTGKTDRLFDPNETHLSQLLAFRSAARTLVRSTENKRGFDARFIRTNCH